MERGPSHNCPGIVMKSIFAPSDVSAHLECSNRGISKILGGSRGSPGPPWAESRCSGSGEIWHDLERSGPGIREKSFPPAPPCPQTPKPPNHQDTGNLKLFPHARPLKGRRIITSINNSKKNNNNNMKKNLLLALLVLLLLLRRP